MRFSETPADKSLPLGSRIATLDAELKSPFLKSAHEYLDEETVVDLHLATKPEIKSYALSFYKAYFQTQYKQDVLRK